MAISARISRRATRNGAAPPPTGSWPMPSRWSGNAAASSIISTPRCSARRPKLGPHREAMRARIAEIAGLRLDQVSLKATTTEKLGFTGRGEGIAAQAAATIRLPEDRCHDARSEGPRRARCSMPTRSKGLKIATAESCTGGLVAAPADGDLRLLGRGRARLRDLFQRGEDRVARRPGRSDRRARRRQRACRPRHGGGRARPFPRRCGGRHHRYCGPGGGTATKPVGLVHFGLARRRRGRRVHLERRYGDLGREPVRRRAVEERCPCSSRPSR